MGKADKTEKANKPKKHFWKDFKAELKKVIWPTKSQVVNNTLIVIAIVLIVTAIVFVLDLAFEALNTYGIDKLKASVQSSIGTNNENTNSDANNNAEGGEENKEENIEATPTPDDESNVENNLE